MVSSNSSCSDICAAQSPFLCVLFYFVRLFVQTTQWTTEEGQTTQWPKEGQTTQWPKEGQTTQWPKEEQTTQWPREEEQRF
jgi:hypothetical protein